MSRRRFEDRERDDGRNKKRRKVDPGDIENKLESLITKVGEKTTSSLENNLKGLANVLEADLPNYKDRILKIICTCACNLPDKITVYTTLVGLLNVKNYTCGEDFLDLMVDNLKDVLKDGSFERAQLMIRFLADLVNTKVIVPSSLMNLFENFLAVTMEDDVMQVRSDWYVHAVLLSLPWAGKELWDKRAADCERLFNTIENYLSKRQKTHMNGLRVWSSDHQHPQEEYLDCLWAQILKLKTDNWVERHIRRPYNAFDDVFREALQHPLPNIPIIPHTDNVEYPLPQVVFRMFDYTDVPEGPAMPGAHSIERYLVEESVGRIINSHYKDRKECAAQLLTFPEKDKIPLDYCIIEVIFGHLFKQPVSPHLEFFYGSLLVELCKIQQNTIPGVLAQATELLYERINTMNVTCVHRFINWLAYHLSQFQYKLSWDEWANVAELSLESPQRKFVAEILEKCLRSSYHDYLAEVVPEPLHSLLPTAPHFTYKFTDQNGSTPGHVHAKQLVESIKAKKPMGELLVLVNNIPNSVSEDVDMDDTLDDRLVPSLKIDVCFQVIFRAGAKSVSHTFKALEKFERLLKSVVTNEEEELYCLAVLNSFWKHHPQMVQVILDKIIRMKIVQSCSFINWLFSKDMVNDFMRCCMWEMMHSTLLKVTKQTKKLKADLQREQTKLGRMEETHKKESEPSEEQASEGKNKRLEEIEKSRQDVERLSDNLESIQVEQKQVFLIVFQRFVMMLTQHIARCEQQQKEVNTSSFIAILDRLREILYRYHREIRPYIPTLETLLFTPDLDHHILEVFNQYKALRT